MSNSADLPDLNMWLALATPDHVHHQHAVSYWEEQTAEEMFAVLHGDCPGPRAAREPTQSDGLSREKCPRRFCTAANVLPATRRSHVDSTERRMGCIPPADEQEEPPGPPLHRHLLGSMGDQHRLAPSEL